MKCVSDNLPVEDLIAVAKLANLRSEEISGLRRKDAFKNLRDAAFLAAVIQGAFECGVAL